jgi:hypothetical protein
MTTQDTEKINNLLNAIATRFEFVKTLPDSHEVVTNNGLVLQVTSTVDVSGVSTLVKLHNKRRVIWQYGFTEQDSYTVVLSWFNKLYNTIWEEEREEEEALQRVISKMLKDVM